MLRGPSGREVRGGLGRGVARSHAAARLHRWRRTGTALGPTPPAAEYEPLAHSRVVGPEGRERRPNREISHRVLQGARWRRLAPDARRRSESRPWGYEAEDAQILAFAVGCLQNLCHDREWSDTLVQLGAHSTLEALVTHPDPLVVRNKLWGPPRPAWPLEAEDEENSTDSKK